MTPTCKLPAVTGYFSSDYDYSSYSTAVVDSKALKRSRLVQAQVAEPRREPVIYVQGVFTLRKVAEKLL
jgi:hypothetical protein